MALHRTITYYGEEEGNRDLPRTWYHYLVIASPGIKPGSGVASIMTLSKARVEAISDGPAHTLVANEGGAEGALAKAEEFLDRHHLGLRRIMSG
jgi:hypothetical protein